MLLPCVANFTGVNVMGGKDLHNRIKINKNSDEAFSFYASMAIEKVLECLSTSVEGLHTETALQRQNAFGKNVITTGKKDTALHRIRKAIINPFNVILLVIAAITFITDVVIAPQPDYLTVGIICHRQKSENRTFSQPSRSAGFIFCTGKRKLSTVSYRKHITDFT